MVKQQIQIAFDVLWSNAKVQSAKPLALHIGSVANLYLFATEKEITVSHQRLESGLKGPVDVGRYERCLTSQTPWLQGVWLEPHPIHAVEGKVSHLLVHVPKPAKRQPYFKLRTNYRYILTLLFKQETPPNLLPLSVGELGDDALKMYTPTTLVIQDPPQMPVAAAAAVGPNPFLEQSFPAFTVTSQAEAELQQLLISCNADESSGPQSVVKWTRYCLYDLESARKFAEPASDLQKQVCALYDAVIQALDVLWRLYSSIPTGRKADILQGQDEVFQRLPALFHAIVPLCSAVYATPYARAKRDTLMAKTQVVWPHGPTALKQLEDNGFVHTATLLQPDRAICRHCSFVGYAWRRLLPPALHHQPTCPRLQSR